jgi:hypothetical protein
MPWGFQSKWSRTQTESNPNSSHIFAPSTIRDGEAALPKWGNKTPNWIFAIAF